jgi:hypothetical protein
VRARLALLSVVVLPAAVGCTSLDAGEELELQQAAVCTATQLTPVAAVAAPAPKQPARNAIDGKTTTRWESAFSDPQWIYVDLGAVKTITQIKIEWQSSAAKDYRVDVSNDAVNWGAPIVTKTGMPTLDHRLDDLTFPAVNARYVRIYGTARTKTYGYSIWELSLFDGSCSTGTAGSSGTGTGTGTAGTGGTTGTGTGTAGTGGTTGTAGSCASNNLTTATNLVATASSGTASRAFDNAAGTRWESASSDPQWIAVDLGALRKVNRVRIEWERAASKDYRIDVSADGVSWSAPVVTKTNMPDVVRRIDDLTGFSVNARFVRMYGTKRTTVYGHSIWEMDVYGDANPSCGGSSTGTGGTTGTGTGTGGTTGTGTGTAGTGGSTGTAGSPAACVNDVFTTTGAVASSSTQAPSRAIDGSTTTRWESATNDPQWLYFDLGSRKALRQLRIDWETASASTYQIEVSDDASAWSPILTRTGLGAVQHRIDDTFGIFGAGRYVRILGTQRSTPYGYSIWEIRASGDANPGCGNLLTAGWNPASVASTFTPTTGYTLGTTNKNAIAFDYLGKSYTTPGMPQLIEFAQSVKILKGGTQWRVTLDVTGMNDQAGLPPRFIATLDGIPVTAYLPATATIASSGGQLITVGSLTTGRKLIMDFGVSLATNAQVDLVLTNVPTFSPSGASSGAGTQKFSVTDVTLERLDLN